MADNIYQAIARLRYPNAPAISGSGPYAILGKDGIRLFETWAAMNTAKNPSENWLKLSEPKPEPPRFNPLAAKFRKMLDASA